jgi:hypothetical protein
MNAFKTRLKCDSGTAFMEFALSAPLLIGFAMYGLELGNITLVNRSVSQAAMSIGDNISRVGPADGNAGITTVDESDVNDVLTGGKIETGGAIDPVSGVVTPGGINLTQNGRVILSSLEVNAAGHQYIHWQRCKGVMSNSAITPWTGIGSAPATNGSSFGVQGSDKGDTALATSGMGPTGAVTQAIQIGANPTASTGTGVMYVEIWYQYQPLFPMLWTTSVINRGGMSSFLLSPGLKELHYTAAFLIRDQRNYTIDSIPSAGDGAGITDLVTPIIGTTPPKATCNLFTV